jgi:hypothetical protein
LSKSVNLFNGLSQTTPKDSGECRDLVARVGLEGGGVDQWGPGGSRIPVVTEIRKIRIWAMGVLTKMGHPVITKEEIGGLTWR